MDLPPGHPDDPRPPRPPRQAARNGAAKVMLTFRLPPELVTFLRAEASRGGRDLTGQVVRALDGLRTYCGLPEAATALLEADRGALGMERHEYLLHVLYQRSLEVRHREPGYDAPFRVGTAGRPPEVPLEEPGDDAR